MKTKLLFALLSFALFSNSYSQIKDSDYQSSLINPSKIINQGNVLYIQGDKNLYKIDTGSSSPIPTTIYSPSTNFYINNLTINGSVIYLSEENYDKTVDKSYGSRIVAIDLNNLSVPANVIYTTTQYVSSLAVKGDYMYFTSETSPDANDKYTLQVHKINYTQPNPVATIIVNNLTKDNGANDMAFYSNNLLILVGRQGKIYGFDTTDSVINVTSYYTKEDINTPAPTGFYVNGNDLFVAEGNVIKRKQNIDSNAMFYPIATNITSKPTKKTAISYPPFEDVVVISDRLFMTSTDQGKVTTVQDSSLSKDEFIQDLNTVFIYNSKTKLVVSGLKNNEKAMVYNLSGQLIITKELSENENSINLSLLNEGTYLLKLGNQKTFKFIK